MKDFNLQNIIVVCVFIIGFLVFIYKKFLQNMEIEVFKEVYSHISENISLPNKKILLIRYFIRFFIVIFLSISLFNPSFEKENISEEKNLTGVDILFLVDVSLSMNAVDSIPSRLDKFKETVLNALPSLTGNRLGIIAFANTPFLYCPMTNDLSAFSDYIKGMDVNMISNAGTNISKAMKKADEVLKSSKIKRNRVLVIVSDGEDVKGGTGTKVEADVIIWGVGTEDGGFIYYKNEETNQAGYVTKTGQLSQDISNSDLIKTRMDKEFLFELASKNNAEFQNLNSSSLASNSLLEKISSMQKNSTNILSNLEKKDGYQYFLFIAILLLMIDILLLEHLIFKK